MLAQLPLGSATSRAMPFGQPPKGQETLVFSVQRRGHRGGRVAVCLLSGFLIHVHTVATRPIFEPDLGVPLE
jgi:hypothetical protein